VLAPSFSSSARHRSGISAAPMYQISIGKAQPSRRSIAVVSQAPGR
jgi:hypothetical protein